MVRDRDFLKFRRTTYTNPHAFHRMGKFSRDGLLHCSCGWIGKKLEVHYYQIKKIRNTYRYMP